MTTSSFNTQNLIKYSTICMRSLSKAFDHTAAWVTKLSWWKFFIFAILLIISGNIIQETLFSPDENDVSGNATANSTTNSTQTSNSSSKSKSKNKDKTVVFSDKNNSKIEIDNSGIRITKADGGSSGKRFDIDANGVHVIDGNDGGAEIQSPKPNQSPNSTDTDSSQEDITIPRIKIGGKEIHIQLPQEIARELRAEMDNEINNAAKNAAKAEKKKKSSTWFANFVLLLIFGLFGMKALMGGKVRAEEQAKQANMIAEKEALLRQVSEAQMQMMQAQVEPHFLFNTLASVEYLIETDPPRAAAMQRSLIAYLRAVLPQIRDKAATTNLGREADMVKSYLELLKMRMEERLEIDFLVPDSLRTASFPPMMLQSLVENAIKHGLEVKAEGGTLSFRAEKLNDKLRVTVSDDGLGFGAVASNGTGLGLQNIRERLKLLYKGKAQIMITANQPSGVCVCIEIPYELANRN